MLFGLTCVTAYQAWQWLTAAARWPIRTVEVIGDLPGQCPDRVATTLAPAVAAGLWRAPLPQLQAALNDLPWIADASLSRQWPDRLQVVLRTHRAAARWQDHQAITPEGRVFAPPMAELPPGLPQLHGPTGQERQLLTYYRAFAPRLAALGLTLTEVVIDRREALRLHCQQGLTIDLGRGEIEPRLTRFCRAYPRLTPPPGQRIARVDMRYSNGLAVAWQAASSLPQQ